MTNKKLLVSRPKETVFFSTPQHTEISLIDFKEKFKSLCQDFKEVDKAYKQALNENDVAKSKHTSWENGLLFRRIFKAKFEQIRLKAEQAELWFFELKDEYEKHLLDLSFGPLNGSAEKYQDFVRAYDSLLACNVIWKTTSSPANDYRQRDVGSTVSRSTCRISHHEQSIGPIVLSSGIPRFSSSGKHLYLFPVFAILESAEGEFELVALSEVEIFGFGVKFVEDERMPSDANRIGYTWEKANKDGSRDLRFKQNRQMPLIRYGKLTVKLPGKFELELMTSNDSPASKLAELWMLVR